MLLEVLDQVGAVEDAGTQIPGQRGQPAAAVEAAGVAHGVAAAHAVPVGQRRPGDDDRPAQFGMGRGHHHHGPAALAVADHHGLALGIGVQLAHLAQERRLGVHDVLDGLARNRVGQKADEVAGMAGGHRDADLAVGLEAADAGAVAGARVDHHERPLALLDRDAGRRRDPHQAVIDRPRQGAAIDHEIGVELQHVGRLLRHVLEILVAALAQHVPEQDRALGRVEQVGAERVQGSRIDLCYRLVDRSVLPGWRHCLGCAMTARKLQGEANADRASVAQGYCIAGCGSQDGSRATAHRL